MVRRPDFVFTCLLFDDSVLLLFIIMIIIMIIIEYQCKCVWFGLLVAKVVYHCYECKSVFKLAYISVCVANPVGLWR